MKKPPKKQKPSMTWEAKQRVLVKQRNASWKERLSLDRVEERVRSLTNDTRAGHERLSVLAATLVHETRRLRGALRLILQTTQAAEVDLPSDPAKRLIRQRDAIRAIRSRAEEVLAKEVQA